MRQSRLLYTVHHGESGCDGGDLGAVLGVHPADTGAVAGRGEAGTTPRLRPRCTPDPKPARPAPPLADPMQGREPAVSRARIRPRRMGSAARRARPSQAQPSVEIRRPAVRRLTGDKSYDLGRS